MLTARFLGLILLATLVSTAFPPSAGLAAPGECDTSQNPWCEAEDDVPGSPGNRGGKCLWNGNQVPCQDPAFGFYVGGGCYWKALDPQPALTPPPGSDPAEGSWGTRSCYRSPGAAGVTQAFQWLDSGGATPAVLAQRALARIQLLGARIGITPSSAGSGAVGLPVWLWTAVSPGTWGPLSASASGGGVTVTITARARRIVWSMGDGGTLTCDNPGTAYASRFGAGMSPTCGYRYAMPSVAAANPQGRFTVTATTVWTVDWVGGGQSGVLTPTSQSQTTVRIGEIPVVVGR